MMQTIVAFIPARGGSKGIPRKNIKALGGKPLIAYSIETAFKSGISRAVVDTDDEEIAQVAKQYGAEILMRSASLGKDTTGMHEVLRAEVPRIDPEPDLVLLLQPTTPFRNHVQVKIAIDYFTHNLDNYDSLISVEKVPDKYNPYAMILEMPAGKRMLFRKLTGVKEKLVCFFTGKRFAGPNLSGFPINQRMTRRQDLPQAWLPTGSVYLFKTENLKTGSMYGERVMLFETEATININTPEDFEEAEKQLSQ